MNVKNWEVGSTWYADNFNSDAEYQEHLNRLEEERNVTLLSTCRSAVSMVLSKLGSGKRALIPSFTCHSVVSPFVNAGYEFKGYPITENLEIDIDGLSILVESFRPDVILVHGYFGFDTLGAASEYIEWCRTQGIIIIEDMTQTMFSTFRRPEADYTVGSIRKWLPIPDGAFLSNVRMFGLKEDITLVEAKIEAMRAKSKYIVHGVGAKDFMPKFVEAESILDSRTKPYAISNISLTMLDGIEPHDLARCRRDNYNNLAARLQAHSEISVVFPNASHDEAPFLLPVYISEGRSDFQRYMAQHNVYPTIIWKCPDELERELQPAVRRIYDSILCFHVDQRYNQDDMDKVADIIDSYFNDK